MTAVAFGGRSTAVEYAVRIVRGESVPAFTPVAIELVK